MKKWKKIVAIIATLTLVLANITSVFAGRGGHNNDNNNKFDGTYDHIAIAIKTVDGSGYELAEKPTVYIVEEKNC